MNGPTPPHEEYKSLMKSFLWACLVLLGLKTTSLSYAFLCLPMVESPRDSWQEGTKIPEGNQMLSWVYPSMSCSCW